MALVIVLVVSSVIKTKMNIASLTMHHHRSLCLLAHFALLNNDWWREWWHCVQNVVVCGERRQTLRTARVAAWKRLWCVVRVIIALIAHGTLEVTGGRCCLHLKNGLHVRNNKVVNINVIGQCYNEIGG